MFSSDLQFFPHAALFEHKLSKKKKKSNSWLGFWNAPLHCLIQCKRRAYTLFFEGCYERFVIFHFLCRDCRYWAPHHNSSFHCPSPTLSDHLMLRCNSCTVLLAIFHLLFTFPVTWCAAVWNLDMRSWKQTVPSAGEVDQCLPMWVEMFASLDACCRQPVVVTSVLRISEKFNNEEGVTWHSPLIVGLICPADICSFISNG